MNIYVSVGTHEQPFQRLLDAVRDTISSTEHSWRVQFGIGSFDLRHPEVSAAAYLTADEVTGALEWADVMVSQASPGNTFGALELGVWPIVLGRQKRFDEHVDDHQVRFASALQSMGLATDLITTDRLTEVIEFESLRSSDARREAIASEMSKSAARRARFGAETWPLITALLDS